MILIIEFLSSQSDWITLSHLAEAVGASGRTVSDDIAKLKERWGSLFDIEVSVKRGVNMRNKSISTAGTAFREIFNESTALRWLMDLLFHPKERIEFYEDKLFSSKSTLGRMMPKINLFLNQRGINILYQNCQCQIVAENEQQLRQFYAAFLLEMNGISMPEIQTDVNIERMWKIVSGILAKAVPPEGRDFVIQDDITTVYHVALYIVSLIRESQGHRISSEYDISDEMELEDIFYIKSCFPGISVSNLRPINAFINKTYNGWSSPEEKALLREHAALFFAELFMPTDIQLDDESMMRLLFIMDSMYLTEKHRTFQTSLLFDRIEYFSKALSRSSRFMYHRTARALERLSKSIGFDMTPRLHDLLFWICLAFPDFPSFSRAKTALLISDFGTPHADSLVSHVSGALHSLGATIDIDKVVSPEAISSCCYQNYDMILTTMPCLPIKHDNIILVGCYPTHENILDIYKRCMA